MGRNHNALEQGLGRWLQIEASSMVRDVLNCSEHVHEAHGGGGLEMFIFDWFLAILSDLCSCSQNSCRLCQGLS